MEIEPALKYLRDNAQKLAKAHADKVYLEQFRKTKKALLMVEAEVAMGITVVSKQEVYAYAHPEYQELLDGLRVAVEEYERLKHLQITAQLKVDVWRSLNANSRKEFENYGN